MDQREPNTKEVLGKALVCCTAVFSVVTRRSCPIDSGEERCKTTPKTAVYQTRKALEKPQSHPYVIPVCLDNNALSWFTNYLQEGQQCCIIDGISSKNLPVTPGVPQGSILASFFFFWSLSIFPVLLATLLQPLQTTQSTVM